MKRTDLKNIKEWYTEYRSLLFNNDIPDVSKIDFKLHSLRHAAGYSLYVENPKSKSGNNHIIAFCRLYKFSEDEIKEILIHEMIHLWQDSHVKHERYKVCTNTIAHDRVFRTKMSTINLILKKELINLAITETFDTDAHNVKLDEDIKVGKKYNILMSKHQNDKISIIKTSDKYFNKINEELKLNKNIKELYTFKSNDVIFLFFDSTKDLTFCKLNSTLPFYNNEYVYEKYKQYANKEK